MGGDDRDTILKRRAHFVAAALASAGVVGSVSPSCAKKDPPASPVTSVHVAEAGAESIEPDAEAPPVEPTELPDAGANSEAAGQELTTSQPPDTATPPKPPPRPCLSPPAPGHRGTKPQICLDFVN